MALTFQGDKHFARPPGDVWAKLADARFLVQCIPNAEVIGVPDATTAVCKLRPGFAFVRGILEVKLVVENKVDPASVRLALHSKAMGASSDVQVVIALAPEETGTGLRWTAEITSLGGLLKMVPQGLIRGAAQSVIDDVWKEAEARIANTP